MNLRNILAVSLVLSASACALQADELYQNSWRGTAYHTAANGKVVTRRVTEADYVNQAAANNGLSAKTLTLVYRANKHDIAVVRLADGAFIADAIQLEYQFTEAGTPDQTQIFRQSFLFDEGHDAALGSAFGTERSKRDANGSLRSFSYRGSFNYAYPDTGEIISGTFSTGRIVVDRTAANK